MLEEEKKKGKRYQILAKAREKSKYERENRLIGNAMTAGNYINQNPGRCLSEIARTMHWSSGKVQHVLNYGEKKVFSVESKYSIENGRTKRKFYPVPWYNSMDWANLEDNETTDLMVKKVAALQTRAHEQGHDIEIKDGILREKLKRLFDR